MLASIFFSCISHWIYLGCINGTSRLPGVRATPAQHANWAPIFFHLHAGLQKIGTQICFQLQPNTLFQPKNAPHTRRRHPAHAQPATAPRQRAACSSPREPASTSTARTTSPRDALALRRPSRVPRWRRAAPSSCASSRSPAGWPRSSPLSRGSCSASPGPARRDAPASPLVLATYF